VEKNNFVFFTSTGRLLSRNRAILVSCYAKLANLYEEYRPLVAPVFARCTNSVDVEIQQRAAGILCDARGV
jgi:hypothetical protein